jgi:exonuclease SbcC
MMDNKGESGIDYKSLSGGEAYRVDLSIRIALSKLLARRNNFRCSTLIIDEGLGSLDAGGRQRFVQLMESLKNDFERIICITHTEIADEFRTVLKVKKENGKSKIEWLH